MFLRLIYLWRNLTRNLLRSLLTCFAVALPIMIYVLSMAVVAGIDKFLDNSVQQLRLAITHKTSIINPLPEGHRAKIESLDPTRTRLKTVCGIKWIGGRVDGSQRPLSAMGLDVDTFPQTFPELGLTEDEIAAWHRDRMAIAVGRANAEHFGWKTGDRINVRMSIPPYSLMEFHIISTLPDATDNITMWCRRDYIEAEFKRVGAPEGLISFFFAKCGSAADVEYYRKAIDDFFANSIDETKTQDEKAFMNEYIVQQFDLPRKLRLLALTTVFVAVLAAANTMSMNFRDRINEFATLKSMGFRGGLVFGLVQVESLALCGIGGTVGAMGPFIAFNYTALKGVTIPLIQTLEIPPDVCAKALLVAGAIGVLAAIWPSWSAVRMPVIRALRDLG